MSFKGVVCATLLYTLARADSIELRDGRHLQGKYLGGTTTAIGFMTDRAIEYFPISNVLVLVFDSANVGYRPSGFGLNPTRVRHTPKGRRGTNVRHVTVVSN